MHCDGTNNEIPSTLHRIAQQHELIKFSNIIPTSTNHQHTSNSSHISANHTTMHHENEQYIIGNTALSLSATKTTASALTRQLVRRSEKHTHIVSNRVESISGDKQASVWSRLEICLPFF